MDRTRGRGGASAAAGRRVVCGALRAQAVVLENFSKLYKTDPNLVSNFDLDEFSAAWAHFDPDATHFIPSTQLADFLRTVPRPLGLKGRTHNEATRLCMRLSLPQHRGMVAYDEVLSELVDNNYFRTGARRGSKASAAVIFEEGSFKEEGVANGKIDLTRFPPRPETPRAHASSKELLKESAFVQSAPTVAHVYAMKQLARYMDRTTLDQWRLRALRRANGELMCHRDDINSMSKAHDALRHQGASTSAQTVPRPTHPPQASSPHAPPRKRLMRPLYGS